MNHMTSDKFPGLSAYLELRVAGAIPGSAIRLTRTRSNTVHIHAVNRHQGGECKLTIPARNLGVIQAWLNLIPVSD